MSRSFAALSNSPRSGARRYRMRSMKASRAEVRVRFEIAPELVSGVELRANGQKLAWSIADYLASMEKKVGELLNEQAKVAAPATADGARAPRTDWTPGEARPFLRLRVCSASSTARFLESPRRVKRSRRNSRHASSARSAPYPLVLPQSWVCRVSDSRNCSNFRAACSASRSTSMRAKSAWCCSAITGICTRAMQSSAPDASWTWTWVTDCWAA